jgi:outer membrane protein
MKRLSFFFAVLVIVLPAVVSADEIIKKGEVLTVERCVEIGLKMHPSIYAARGNVDVFYARKGQAASGYYPQVNASAGYRRFQPSTNTAFTTSRSVSTPGLGDPAVDPGPGQGTSTSVGGPSTHSFWEYTTDVTATMTIFDFWRTRTQVSIAKLDIDAATSDLMNNEDQVIFGVKQAYYTLLNTKRNLEVAGDTVTQFQEHLEQAKAFYEVGTKPKFDVTNAEVDLGNARLAKIKAENSLKVARVTLNNTLGVPDAPEFEIEDNLSFVKYNIGLQEAISRAFENRPELKSLAYQKKAAEEAVWVAKTGYFPVLAGNASYSWAGHQFDKGYGWSTGLVVSVPVFNGFLTKSQVSEARANLSIVTANEEQLRQNVLLEVQQAYQALTDLEEGIPIAELVVRQAQENVDIANGRYSAGVGNPIEVTDANTGLSNARTNLIQALSNYKIARASLEKSMGVR